MWFNDENTPSRVLSSALLGLLKGSPAAPLVGQWLADSITGEVCIISSNGQIGVSSPIPFIHLACNEPWDRPKTLMWFTVETWRGPFESGHGFKRGTA